MKYLVLVFILFTFTYGSTDPLIASYDKGLDLILLESDFIFWYQDFLADLDGQYPPESREQARPYSAFYWNSNDNTYYDSHMRKTNNIIYTLDTNQQNEALFYPSLYENFPIERLPNLENKDLTNRANIYLLYAGSISKTERLYINGVNNEQYLKILYPVSVSHFDSPISPRIVINEYEEYYWTNVFYTNKQGMFKKTAGFFEEVETQSNK